jgi:hypothetical protein
MHGQLKIKAALLSKNNTYCICLNVLAKHVAVPFKAVSTAVMSLFQAGSLHAAEDP